MSTVADKIDVLGTDHYSCASECSLVAHRIETHNDGRRAADRQWLEPTEESLYRKALRLWLCVLKLWLALKLASRKAIRFVLRAPKRWKTARKRQPAMVFGSMPWAIPVALMILWGVVWMFKPQIAGEGKELGRKFVVRDRRLIDLEQI